MDSSYTADMLAACRQAPRALKDQSAAARAFITGLRNPDGGYRGRSPQSDLYYTGFAAECLLALGESPATPALHAYLATFGSGRTLNFIHLTSLARCWALVPDAMPAPDIIADWEKHLLTCRTPDGGFNTVAGATRGSASGTFLAYLALDGLGKRFPLSLRMVLDARSLRSTDGAYANEPGMESGTTLATAAMLVLRNRLGLPAANTALRWLDEHCLRDGGYLAHPRAPTPDLLSTATVLYAFRRLGIKPPPDHLSASLNFIESLFQDTGGFAGSWLDETPDAEYTYYGLLALGCLADMSSMEAFAE